MTAERDALAEVALAAALCHEYHPMHWDVAYGNRNRPCGACRIHAAALAGYEPPGSYARGVADERGKVDEVVRARNYAMRQRDEERAAKEGNIAALNVALNNAEGYRAMHADLAAAVKALADEAADAPHLDHGGGSGQNVLECARCWSDGLYEALASHGGASDAVGSRAWAAAESWHEPAPDERGASDAATGQRVMHYPTGTRGDWWIEAGAHSGARADCPKCEARRTADTTEESHG
jgi:hypothetical protein